MCCGAWLGLRPWGCAAVDRRPCCQCRLCGCCGSGAWIYAAVGAAYCVCRCMRRTSRCYGCFAAAAVCEAVTQQQLAVGAAVMGRHAELQHALVWVLGGGVWLLSWCFVLGRGWLGGWIGGAWKCQLSSQLCLRCAVFMCRPRLLWAGVLQGCRVQVSLRRGQQLQALQQLLLLGDVMDIWFLVTRVQQGRGFREGPGKGFVGVARTGFCETPGQGEVRELCPSWRCFYWLAQP